jgi:hypothetical protein
MRAMYVKLISLARMGRGFTITFENDTLLTTVRLSQSNLDNLAKQIEPYVTIKDSNVA